MIVKEIFSDSIPALSVMDSAQRALYFMEFFKVSNLPIVDDQKYLGMITDESIIDCEKDNLLIKEFIPEKENTYIYADEHIYNAIFQMSQYKLSLLTVLNREEKYLGTVSPMHLINAMGLLTSVDQSGSILVLKMGIRDYSLSEVAQIVEGHQAKILSSYIHTCKDQHHIKLTLKLNTTNLASIKASFERYKYEIESVFSESQMLDDMHKDRFDELMYYLSI